MSASAPRSRAATGSPARAIVASAGTDAVAVLLFAAVGRLAHEESATPAGVVATAWPFLTGLLLGWAALVALHLHPRRRLAAALPITGTLVFGMLLRRLVGSAGTPLAFVAVATAVVTALLLGWRSLDLYVRRRSSRL